MKKIDKLARTLLIHAINAALKARVVTVEPGPVTCPKEGLPICFGGVPARVHCEDTGYGEVVFRIVLWPTDACSDLIRAWAPSFRRRQAMGEAYAEGFLVRLKAGASLATESGFASCLIAPARLSAIESLPTPEPIGFKAQGGFLK